MLLLEKLAATPRDSVTYYAFAEDNNPAGPRRTETELRYIDIRPFKREYKMGEAGDRPTGEPNDLASLAELIARQRFNLNRTTRLAKHKPGDRTAVDDPLKIAGFEETLAELTRELHRGGRGDRRPADRAAAPGRGIDAGRRRGARPRPDRAAPGTWPTPSAT